MCMYMYTYIQLMDVQCMSASAFKVYPFSCFRSEERVPI